MDGEWYISLLVIGLIFSKLFKLVKKKGEPMRRSVMDEQDSVEEELEEEDFEVDVVEECVEEYIEEPSKNKQEIESVALLETAEQSRCEKTPQPEQLQSDAPENNELRRVDETNKAKRMSPEEKRKLVIYSEIMSPKYKEY